MTTRDAHNLKRWRKADTYNNLSIGVEDFAPSPPLATQRENALPTSTSRWRSPDLGFPSVKLFLDQWHPPYRDATGLVHGNLRVIMWSGE